MLTKEYRICMPVTVDEYQIAQIYMIARFCEEHSGPSGDGVEVVKNEICEDPKYGKGQFTEKKIYLASQLPAWIKPYFPSIGYILEKAWNYYPYVINEYTCSFFSAFCIKMETKYINDCGVSNNVFECEAVPMVEKIDIVFDPIPAHKYKESEDLTKVTSSKTGRGPFQKDWQTTTSPMMCVYKLVSVSCAFWGVQTAVEAYAHKFIKDVMVLGHRKAIAWLDAWYGLSMDDIREYELTTQENTNKKLQDSRRFYVLYSISFRTTHLLLSNIFGNLWIWPRLRIHHTRLDFWWTARFLRRCRQQSFSASLLCFLQWQTNSEVVM